MVWLTNHADKPSQNLFLIITPTLQRTVTKKCIRGKHLSTSYAWSLPRIYLTCPGPFAYMSPRRRILLLGYQAVCTAFPLGPQIFIIWIYHHSNASSTQTPFRPPKHTLSSSFSGQVKMQLGNEASSHWGGEGFGSMAGAHLLGLRGCPGGSSTASYL